MEEKIKELIDKVLKFNNRFGDVLCAHTKDLLKKELVRIFEQEKQAYAKEMCWKAFEDGYNYSSNVAGDYVHGNTLSSSEWILENFPNP